MREKTLSVSVPATYIHEKPGAQMTRGKLESQLVYGETFVAEEEKNDWCHGYCTHDGYRGWVKRSHFEQTSAVATHTVMAQRSDLYQAASIKSPCLNTLSFGSRIKIIKTDGNFSQLDTQAYIFNGHITPIDQIDADHVATALKFLETPYLWGGRSGFGIDCSGLIQVAFARAGTNIPRDTEDQQNVVGEASSLAPARGDIVYFPGHVGIMVDTQNILHANATHMKTNIEPLDIVTARSKHISAVRRIPGFNK